MLCEIALFAWFCPSSPSPGVEIATNVEPTVYCISAMEQGQRVILLNHADKKTFEIVKMRFIEAEFISPDELIEGCD